MLKNCSSFILENISLDPDPDPYSFEMLDLDL